MSQPIRIIFIIIVFTLAATQIQAVTRDELIEKCIAAGDIIKKQDVKTAIKQIEDLNGPFVWNNNINYLFLMNTNGKMLAHPFDPNLKKPDSLLDVKDSNGKRFVSDFVKVAISGNGVGWVKYMWPLPGKKEPIEKYTFVYRVPDTDYFIASGLYVIKPGEYY